MLDKPAPTDQRGGVRPISFVLDNAGSIGSPVSLVIRPEDLTRTEPSRATTHQTLGSDVVGWVDHFGEGLPSVTLSGHTGWRHNYASGMDGAQSFESLNWLVVHEYTAAMQAAVDRGLDPAAVKLLFVDLLDNFAWSVVPTQFVLRRSRSRPLLFQYNISLQAVATGVAFPSKVLPSFGTIPAGLTSLTAAISAINGWASSIESWAGEAIGAIDLALKPVSAVVSSFVKTSTAVFAAANSAVRSANNFVSEASNRFISLAHDVARVGLNVMRTLSNIAGIPAHLRASLVRVAAAYNEVVCIFKNSLRPRQTYDDYTGLYGSSNCSSTTGGRAASAYANQNAFALMQTEDNVVTINTQALSSISTLGRMDSVLAPQPIPEIGRHLTNISTGLAL